MKTRHALTAAAAIILIAGLFASCEKDDTTSTTTDSTTDNTTDNSSGDTSDSGSGSSSSGYNVHYEVANSMYCNGDILEAEVTFTSETVSVTSVEFLWDDELIYTVTEAPYKLEWLIEDQDFGTHKVSSLTHTDFDLEEYTGPTELWSSVYVIETWSFKDFTVDLSTQELANGETLVCTVNENEEMVYTTCIAGVTFSWDGEPVLELSEPPYEIDYLVEDQALGNHILQVEVDYKYGFDTGTSTYTYPITVTDAE